jgi:hypothetical protein
MTLHPAEEKADLVDSCRAAAVSLVAEGGWEALTKRDCETKAGKKRNHFREFTIHEMRVYVVEAAFIEFAVALAHITDPSIVARRELYVALATHLEKSDEAAALMTQVAGLMAAKSGELYKALKPSIDTWTHRVLAFAETFLVEERGVDVAHEKVWRAKELLSWYQAAAVTLVTDPNASRGRLLGLAQPGAVSR